MAQQIFKGVQLKLLFQNFGPRLACTFQINKWRLKRIH
jgi:hypothetical protein